MKTRICEKCGAFMEELNVDSPTNMQGFRCPNRKNHQRAARIMDCRCE